MKKLLVGTGFLVCLAGVSLSAPPANDDQANAQVLNPAVVNGSVTGTTLDATAELGEPAHADFPATRSIWFSFTPDIPGPYRFDTMGSDGDTVLAIYDPTAVFSPGLASNDDISSTNLASQAAVEVGSNPATVLIAVDHKQTSTGDIVLSWQLCSEILPAPFITTISFSQTTTDTLLLEWLPVTGVTDYEILVNGIDVGVTTDTSFTVPLVVGANSITLFARNDCGRGNRSQVFATYCPPADAVLISPIPSSTVTLGEDFLFEWEPVPGATGYNLIVDGESYPTSFTTVLASSLVSAGPFGPRDLGLHSWGVRAILGNSTCDTVAQNLQTYEVCDRPQLSLNLTSGASAGILPCGDDVLLEWFADSLSSTSPTVQLYRLLVDGVEITSGTSTSLNLGPLPDGTYRWQVIAETDINGPCGIYFSAVERFCIQPVARGLQPSPGSLAPCSLNELVWSESCATSDTLYTVFLDDVILGTTTGTSYPLFNPLPPGNHEWGLFYEGPCSAGFGTTVTVRFCIQDSVLETTAVSPLDGAGLSAPPLSLEWTGVCGATSYEVELNDVVIGTTTDTLFVLDGSSNPFISFVEGTNEWALRVMGTCGAPEEVQVFTFDLPLDCASRAPQILFPEDGVDFSCGFGPYFEYRLGSDATTGVLLISGQPPLELDDTGTTTLDLLAPGCYAARIEALTSCGILTSNEVFFEILPEFQLLNPSFLFEQTPVVPCGSLEVIWESACPDSNTSYSVFLDGIFQGQTTGTTFLLDGLIRGFYELQVVGELSCGARWSEFIDFCVSESPRGALSPLDGSTISAAPSELVWDICPSVEDTTVTVFLNGVEMGQTTGSAISVPTTASLEGLNEWLIRVNGLCGGDTETSYTYTLLDCAARVPVISFPTSGTVYTCEFGPFFEYSLGPDVTSGVLLISGQPPVELDDSGTTELAPLAPGCYTVRLETVTTCGLLISEEVSFEVFPEFRLLNPPNIDGVTTVSCGPLPVIWESACDDTGVTYSVFLDGVLQAQTDGTSVILPGLLPGNYDLDVVGELACGTELTNSVSFCVVTPAREAVEPLDGALLFVAPTVLVWDGCTDGQTTFTVSLNGDFVGETVGDSLVIETTRTQPGLNVWTVEYERSCLGRAVDQFSYQFDPSGCPAPGPVTAVFPPDSITNPAVLPCGLDELVWASDPATTQPAEFQIFLNGDFLGTTTAESFRLPVPLDTGTYNWTVIPLNVCGAGTSATFSFCLQDAPEILSPAAEDIPSCNEPFTIRWDGGCGLGSYEVLVDGVPAGTTTGLELELASGLNAGFHTIQIVKTGPCGPSFSDLITLCVQGRPVHVSPADNAVLDPLPTSLNWLAACGATTYTVFLNGAAIGQTTGLTLPIALTPGTGPFFWQVEAQGDCGLTTAPLWSFTDCASLQPPSNPVPFDGETTNGPTLTELRWDPVVGATSYQVFINTTFAGAVSSPVFPLPLILPDNPYTWRVNAIVPGCGSISGPLWRFEVCTLAQAPIPLTPFDGETTRAFPIQFDWTDVPDIISYRIQVDNFVSGDLFVSEFAFNFPLLPGFRQWAPVARTSCGFTTGPVTTFCIVEPTANPTPPNGALLCSAPSLFEWNPVVNALAYDVYLNGLLISTSTTATNLPYTGPVLPGTNSWFVVTHNECDQIASDTFTFEIGETGVPNPLAWMADGVVHAMATDGQFLYIGGEFQNVVSPDGLNRIARRNLAALDLSTGLPTTWDPGATGPVYALAVADGRVFVGGDFLQLGGLPQTRLGSVTAGISGTPVALGAGVSPDGPVRALALSADQTILYVGGEFLRFGPTVRRYIGSISVATGLLTGFNPDPNNSVRAIVAGPSGEVYFGGLFNRVGATLRSGLAQVDSSGLLTAFNANCNLYVYALALETEGLYVGGFFSQIGSSSRSNVALIQPLTGLALPWNPGTNGAVLTLAKQGNGMLLGGLFSQVGSANRPYLARVDTSTAVAENCGFDPDNPVRSIFVLPDTAWVGGDFTVMGGRISRGISAFGLLQPPPAASNNWEIYE
jgi:hypothetical protein